MHPQVTMLRDNEITIAQRHCCPHGCGLVPLCCVDAAYDTFGRAAETGALKVVLTRS